MTDPCPEDPDGLHHVGCGCDPVEGPDAAEVFAALESALQLAEVWLIDGTAGTIDDRLRLYRVVRDWRKRDGRLGEVEKGVQASIVADLGEPREVEGQWYRAHRTPHRKGYDKDALRSAINRTAVAPVAVVDESTGEVTGHRDPSVAEVLDTVWAGADVATSRTKVLRERFDIDLDEYAQTEWRTEVQAIDLTDLPPEQRPTTTEDQ